MFHFLLCRSAPSLSFITWLMKAVHEMETKAPDLAVTPGILYSQPPSGPPLGPGFPASPDGAEILPCSGTALPTPPTPLLLSRSLQRTLHSPSPPQESLTDEQGHIKPPPMACITGCLQGHFSEAQKSQRFPAALSSLLVPNREEGAPLSLWKSHLGRE